MFRSALEPSVPPVQRALDARTRHSRRMTLWPHLRLATGKRLPPEGGSPSDWAATATQFGQLSPGTVRTTLRAVMLMVALTACGGADDGDSETKVPTETSSTTTSTPQAQPSNTATTAAVASCADLAAKASRLAQDARATMRGIAGPAPGDEAKLRARERALRAEARRLGCPVPPGLSSDYVRER